MPQMMIIPTRSDQKPRAKYFSNITVSDLRPLDPFTDWEEADEFLGSMQGEETARRWVTGMAANLLPTERGEQTFQTWCLRNGFEPDRVGVWRRCAALYDLETEVKRFPRLPIKHFECLMGRMSKAKKLRDEKRDYSAYRQVFGYLQEAHDGELSARAMMRQVAIREGKIREDSDDDGMPKPLNIDNCQLAILDVNIEPDLTKAPIWRMCPVLIPTSDAAGKEIEKRAEKRNILFAQVSARLSVVDTE